MASLAALPRAIVIIGPTGSGKSRLAIELAAALDGEVVNADAIQLYRGLDIASAKVLRHERQGIPHHLMSCLDVHQQFTVRDFREVAARVMQDVAARGKLPVIVGGTMYYVQSLLRESLLDETTTERDVSTHATNDVHGDGVPAAARECTEMGDAPRCVPNAEKLRDITDAPAGGMRGSDGVAAGAAACTGTTDVCGRPPLPATNAERYDMLARVDPVMARRLHPNDYRKVERALSVYVNTGRRYSDIVAEQSVQRKAGGRLPPAVGSSPAAPAAVHDAVSGVDAHRCFIVWLQVVDAREHDRRLDARVDTMMSSGLLGELHTLRAALVGPRADATALTAAPTADGVPTPLPQDEPSDLTARIMTEYQSGHALRAANVSRADAEADAGAGDGSGHDYQGVLQAIGYKEFAAYFDELEGRAPEGQPPRSKRPRASSPCAATDAHEEATLAACVRKLKDATHRYARVQQRFIRNRFAKRGVPMHVLDTSNAGAWDADVLSPALTAAHAWLAAPPTASATHAAAAATAAGAAAASDTTTAATTPAVAVAAAATPSAISALVAPTAGAGGGAITGGYAVVAGDVPVHVAALEDDAARIFTWRKHTCDTCARTLNGAAEWAAHLSSRGHAKAIAYDKMRRKLAAERGIILPTRAQRAACSSTDAGGRGAAAGPPGGVDPAGGEVQLAGAAGGSSRPSSS